MNGDVERHESGSLDVQPDRRHRCTVECRAPGHADVDAESPRDRGLDRRDVTDDDDDTEWQEVTVKETPEEYPTQQSVDLDDGYFLVQKILKAKFQQVWRFLTQWEGYPVSDSTWEPIRSFVLPDGRLNEVFVEFCKKEKLEKVLKHAHDLSCRKPNASANAQA